MSIAWPLRRRPDASPSVSVVMPSLNQGRFIGTAIRSVLTQPIEALELVVVDGGSTDQTLNRLVELSGEFPGQLRWFSAPDAGTAQAVNRAVALTSAPLIGWLNSDDMYAPGAIQRARRCFDAHPEYALVYGEGEHIDEGGVSLGRYPTQPPGTPIGEFSNGCFICQPTVYFRRAAFEAAGGLDESYQAAFDFDLWMRLFKAHPGRIGHVAEVQAYSRLHEGGITLRQRERVAVEGLRAIARHLGAPPPHWLLTHFSELAAIHPFHARVRDLRSSYQELVDGVRPMLDQPALTTLAYRIEADRCVSLSTASLCVAVHPDGWAGPVLDLRLRQPDIPIASIRLRCQHVAGHATLNLAIQGPSEPVRSLTIRGHGGFDILIDISDRRLDARLVYRIVSSDFFVPADTEPNSTDSRALAYVVEDVDCQHEADLLQAAPR